MQPSRKRKIRLVVALSAAVVLATALVVTSFSASSEAVSPSQLGTARTGVTYQLTGKVQDGSVRTRADGVAFRVRDRSGSASVPGTYTGAVPAAAVLVDGAGIPGADSLCRHGVAWYAGRLGGGLLSLLSLAPDRGAEGRIVRILERGSSKTVGRFDVDESGWGFVVPFDRRLIMDVQIPSGESKDARPGDMVTVEITKWPTIDAVRSTCPGM